MKALAEDKCEARPKGQTVGNCGVFTYGIRCAACSKRICHEHSNLCRICRDACRHHLFCGDCVNSHRHEDIPEAA